MLTGNPLRRQILEGQKSGLKSQVSGLELNLLVFGGSQGARAINRAMVEALDQLKDFDGNRQLFIKPVQMNWKRLGRLIRKKASRQM